MKKTYLEIFFGAAVLLTAIAFLGFTYNRGEVATSTGYTVNTSFDSANGLAKGMEVRMSGIKIGKIQNIELDKETYQANLKLSIDGSVKLPTDTVAQISTEGLLGGYYLALVPGAEEEYLAEGGDIIYTQPSIDLIQMLGKFMLSGNESKASE